MLFVAVAMSVNRKTPLTFRFFRTIIGLEFVAKPGDERELTFANPASRNRAAVSMRPPNFARRQR